MTLTSAGLNNGGLSDPGGHYQILYDDSASDGATLAAGLLDSCEQDFNTMTGWFGNVGFKFNFPIFIHINNATGGASWVDPSDFQNSFGFNPTVEVNPNTRSVNFIRMLVASEVTEMLMASRNNGWFASGGDIFHGGDEGSKGEGLSRFLAFQLTGLVNGVVVSSWLNSPRANFVDNDPDDNNPDPTTGCTTCFIYYMNVQLGYNVNAIINAGASTLAGVYSNLTGKTDAWNSFSALINLHFPPTPGVTYHPLTDNLFPVPVHEKLNDAGLVSGSTQSFPYLIELVQPAAAEVTVSLTNDNPSILTIPPEVSVPIGSDIANVTIQASAITGPLQTVAIHAAYAGVTLSSSVQIIPRPSIVSGQVTDVSRNPIASASVLIHSDQFIPGGSGGDLQLSTDSNGLYQTLPIPPGVYQISASSTAGYVTSDVISLAVNVGVPDTTQNFTLVARKPSVISGKVTDPSGAPIPLASISLDTYPEAKTDANGDYSFSFAPVSAPNISYATIGASQIGYTTSSVTIAIANGATVTENFTLQLLGSLSGVVTDASNAPIQGATVAAASGSVESDVNGHYDLAGLTPGANNISVKASGFDPLQTGATVNPGPATTLQNFSLQKGSAVITGTVRDGTFGTPLAATIVVNASGSSQTIFSAKTDATGSYTISNLPAGVGTITATAILHATQQSSITVSAHQTITMDFGLFLLKQPPPPPRKPI